jgi:adenosylcobyric acid synthase
MLAERIEDDVESGAGTVDGLGLLPVGVTFAAEKTLGRPRGRWRGHPVQAYEIHHGVATPRPEPVEGPVEAFLDGCRRGPVWGTVWHGALENDGFRRAWLTEVAAQAGSRWRPRPDAPAYGARRETMIDTLADAVEAHLDLDLLLAGTRVTGRAA